MSDTSPLACSGSQQSAGISFSTFSLTLLAIICHAGTPVMLSVCCVDSRCPQSLLANRFL